MKRMKPSSLLLNTIVTMLLYVLQATSDSPLNNFIHCLPHHSHPKSPTSAAIYTQNSSSYSSILLARISNLRFSTSSTPKPLAIIAAKHESHVQATIICAKSHGLQIRIRSGGHDYEGLSYVSEVPFVVLDMFNLRSIHLNLANGIAWVQSGATIGELYYRISQRSNVYGFPAGACPTVGIGGHISGGGYGNMMRKYGLTVDNVIDAKLVDVNGRILDRKSMGEDVFWAIRGGGGSSFGVILSWKIKLVPVPPKVTVFRVKKTIEEGATDVAYQWQLVATKLHEDLFIRVMPEVVNGSKEGKKTIQVSFIGQFLGEIDRLLPLVNKSFPELGLQRSDCTEIPWVNSTVFWADYSIETPINILLSRKLSQIFLKSKSDYVKKPIPKAAMEKIWDFMVKGENVWMQWNPYGGRMHEISPSATPFPHRAGNLFLIQYYTFWEEEGIEATNHYVNFSRSFYEFMTPYVSRSPREAFLDYRDLDIGTNPSNSTNLHIARRTYGSKYYKDNFERLVHAKTLIDPENFFKDEQSIPPH
ncbi:hypothetical protein L6164_032759 [Bauhinia variegata]|uniref:Uncharacterized protein n=1 Tax=Bauhinia variegata TaxID=167791 RepID=A0ACB9KQC5_BAUVA|nr:hypothetical protein L6164_032759 [Bauhinia variegata]